MNAEEIRDLAAVYALGGLEGEDRVRFEALLQAGDPEAASALRDFQGTLLELAAATTEAPPAGVKRALMERIGAQTRVQPSPSIATVRPGHAAAPARRSWWPAVWAAAMAAGIAAIAVGFSLSAMYEKRLEALAAGDARPPGRGRASAGHPGPGSRSRDSGRGAGGPRAGAVGQGPDDLERAKGRALGRRQAFRRRRRGRRISSGPSRGRTRPCRPASSRWGRTERPASGCRRCPESTRWTSSPSRSSPPAACPLRPARCTWPARRRPSVARRGPSRPPSMI